MRIQLVVLILVVLAVSLVVPVRADTLQIDSLECGSSGGNAVCTAVVIGGTGGYTYTWRPTPYATSGDYVSIHCTPRYAYNSVSLTVTDSSGASVRRSTTFYCS